MVSTDGTTAEVMSAGTAITTIITTTVIETAENINETPIAIR